jgi:hypothetical protein
VERESSRLVLRRAFRHLEREIPTSVTRVLRWLRHPRSRWVRIPAGILFILGGFLAILPVFGAWMIPVGPCSWRPMFRSCGGRSATARFG